MRRLWWWRSSRGTGLVLLLFCAGGCGGFYSGWEVRTNSTPVAPSFYQIPIEEKPVAIMPALSISSLQGTEVGVSRYLVEILEKSIPAWTVLDEQESLTGINEHGLGPEYIQMRREAGDTHLLTREALRKIGAALGVRYIFQPRLAYFSQATTYRWEFPAVDLWFMFTRSSVMRISLELWEVESGKLTWSSMAESFMQSDSFSYEPVFLEDLVRVTLGGLVTDFLNRRTASKYTTLDKMIDPLLRKVE